MYWAMLQLIEQLTPSKASSSNFGVEGRLLLLSSLRLSLSVSTPESTAAIVQNFDGTDDKRSDPVTHRQVG